MVANAAQRARAPVSCARILVFTIAAASSNLTAARAHAAATLTVDLSTAYRPATHVGSGSLYGVTEKVPADDDLEGLVGALHPKMFTNPASSDPGTQQPGIPANAIKVAARLAPLGATVTVRLADWFSGWYAFTNMTDWLGKIGTTIAAKKTANLDNIYAYEIWNEPNGSWTNGGDTNAVPGGSKTLSWNAFWKQSYDKIRQLDPAVKITGPSISYMDPDFMKGFLTYCKSNDCLPDVIGWHEGMNIETDVANYRNLEKQIGVGPLPISINEYSGSGQAKDEGRPGATVPLIAQLERAGVESACVSWWTPDSIAGHLGSLLATDTQTNGGWFLFEWYGAMNGSMVMTTPALAKDGKNLDGVASLDTSGRKAYVLAAGVSDGTVQIVIQGWKSAAPLFGSKVHALVDRTHWTGRSGVVTSTDTLSTADLTITNDAVTVFIGNANGDDGYRVSLTPADDAADAGAIDAGTDAGGNRDAREAGGDSGSGGIGGVAGTIAMDAGGNAGAGGTTRSGGSTSLASGGFASSAATTNGRGGGTGSGPMSSVGGADGGAATGGATGGWDGQMSSTGLAGGQTEFGSGGTSGASTETNRGTSGCSCAVSGKGKPAVWWILPLTAALLGLREREKRKPAIAASQSRHPLAFIRNRLLYRRYE